MTGKPHYKPPADLLYRKNSLAMQSTAHAAASDDDPALRGWRPPAGSPDADLLGELDIMVPRSRDLVRNNGYAAGGNQTLKDNIIGHQLRLASKPDVRLLGWERTEAKNWARDLESQFGTWANVPGEIDAGRSMGLLGLSLQALGGWFLNGEALGIVHWLPREMTRWNTKIQVIEADRLETPPDKATDPRIRGGVEIDRFGAAVAIHVRKSHPGDALGSGIGASAIDGWPRYTRIPAYTSWGRRRFIHLHDKERSGQTRGKPLVAAIMREFRMGSHWMRTELQSSVANSLIAAFLETGLSQEDAAALFASGDDAGKYWKDSVEEWRPQLKGGAVIPLPPGGKIQSHIPGRPNAAFEQFMVTVLRNIAAGLNIPYELLAKDFSKTNYSSARAALLEAWRYFLGRRRWLMDYWLNPIYELWLEEAVNAGVVPAPDFYQNRYAYARCRWVFAGRGWVDPAKEAQAAGLRLKYGITTLEHEGGEQGLDWEEVIDQRADELAYMRERGVPYEVPDNAAAAAATADDKDETDEEGGEQEQEKREAA